MAGERNPSLLCALFAARDPQRCAGHAVISSEIHVNFNKTGQISLAQICRRALQKRWMEISKELDSGAQHTWKYVNALLCKWT